MNFDRKISKASHNGNNPAEHPYILDNDGQEDFVNSDNAPEYYQDGVSGQYSSGAFPALNIAYPDADIDEDRKIIGNGNSNFVSDKHFSANINADNAPDYEQSAYGEEGQYQPRMPDDGAGGSAWSNADMADRNYGGNGADHGDARQRNYSADYDAQNPSAPGNNGNPFYGGQNGADGQADFTDDSFRGGLSGEQDVQPAHFAPSDYDYGFNSADYDGSDRQNQGGISHSGQAYAAADEGYHNGGAAYAPQPHDGQAYYNGDADYSSAPQGGYDMRGDPAGSGQNSAGDYGLSDSAYQKDNGASYAGADNSYASQGYGSHYYEQGGQQDYASQPYAGSYAPESFAPGGQTGENISSDFARLDADVSQMDRAAGAFPPMDGRDAVSSAYAQADSNYGAGQAQPEWAASDSEYPSEQDGLIKDAESYPIDPAQEQTSGSEADAVSPDAAYDDDSYEWEEPAVPAAIRQAEAVKQKRGGKSRGLMFFAVFLILLGLAGAGVYLKFGSSLIGDSGQPVTIHNTAGNYKIKGTNPQTAVNTQEQSVTDDVGNNASQAQQKTLVDKTESPIEVQKMSDRLPLTDESKPFDQSAVDSMVQTVVAQATPVHIVPSIKVDGDRKVVAASARGEKVLTPGSDMADANVEADSFAAEEVPQTAQSVQPAAVEKKAAPEPTARNREETASARPAKTEAAQSKAPPKEKAKPSAAGGFFMQISSQPSKEAAEQSMRAAKKRLSADIAGKVAIVPAAIPGKGTYYRVRVAAGSREDAMQMCDAYKKAGGNCFISK